MPYVWILVSSAILLLELPVMLDPTAIHRSALDHCSDICRAVRITTRSDKFITSLI